MRKVAVIGAGIGGLAAALRLAARGYEVEVFEQYHKPGGKLMEFAQKGFRFDMGPSLFTMPDFVTELFDLFGKQADDYLRFSQLENTCNYYFSDRSLIRAWRDHDRFLEQADPADRPALSAYLTKARTLFESTADIFLFHPFPSKSAFLSPQGRRIGQNPGMLDAFTTLHRRHRKSFKDPRLVQLFDRYATYNGSDPYQTPATLKMIAHLEHNIGAFFPAGGMYEIIRAMVRLAEEAGITIHLNTRVDAVEAGPGKGIRLEAGGERRSFDLLVNDVDVYTFYSQLLKGGKVPRSVKWQQRSTSALIFYWGVSRSFPDLDVHNILFTENYRAEFADLFRKKVIHHDPTVYLFISSKIVPGDAPAGMENWFVMVNTPEDTGQDWDHMIAEARVRILEKIQYHTGADISDLILTEKVVDPREIARRTGSFRGSLYGTSSNNRFSAFLRHPNRRTELPGVFFVGGSVHPGGGIPLCLASAKIVANQIPHAHDQA